MELLEEEFSSDVDSEEELPTPEALGDELEDGLEFEKEKAFEFPSFDKGRYCGSLKGTIYIPSQNILILSKDRSIHVFSTESDFNEVKKINIESRIENFEQLNNEVAITTQLDSITKKPTPNIICYSIRGLHMGEVNATHIFPTISFYHRNLKRIDDDRFLCIYPSYSLAMSKNYPKRCNYTEIFSISKKKKIKEMSFNKRKITTDSIIKASQKYDDCVYISFSNNEDNELLGEKIILFSVSSGVVKYFRLGNSFLLVTDMSITKNKENEELVVAVGYDCACFVRIINFSKSPPEVLKKLEKDDDKYGALEPVTSITASYVLMDQLLFIGDDEFGSVSCFDMKDSRKYFNQKVLKEEFGALVKKIVVISISKYLIKMACFGENELSVVNFKGIEIDLSSIGENKFVLEDEKERVSFLFNFKDLYLFNDDLKKKSFLEIKLLSKVIQNVVKILL